MRAGLADERLRAEHKVRRRSEYQRCYRQGRRCHGPFATLHYAANDLGHARLGITASRKVGKAHVRQLLKRRVREVYRRWPRRDELPAVDLVVHLKPASADAGFEPLALELDRLLRCVIPRSGEHGRAQRARR